MKHAASGLDVRGDVVDQQTRCVHYATPRDVVAIKFACCSEFYPCHACHEAASGHDVMIWPIERRQERALLCGECGSTLSIDTYLAAEACPECAAAFNPGCRLHAHYYFAS